MTIKSHEEEVDFGSRRYLFKTNITIDRNERQKQLGHYRYTPQSVRKQVLERDNHTCQLCGGAGNIADHIIPWRISRDNSPLNLRCLCVKCNTATRLKRRDARLSYEDYFKQIESEYQELASRELVSV